jgi:hypothetical protein
VAALTDATENAWRLPPQAPHATRRDGAP